MADDTAKLTALLEQLKTAYYSGSESVMYDGKNVRYRSSGDLLLAIEQLERKLGIALPPQRIVVRTEKGW